jgi:hypothetical protein
VLTTFDVLVVQRHARDFVIEKSLSMAATTTAAIESVGMCRPQSGGHFLKTIQKGDSAPRSILLLFLFFFPFIFFLCVASFTIFTGRHNLNADGQLATVNTSKADS